MTKDQIRKLAEEAELNWAGPAAGYEGISVEDLARFANLVAQAERKACAFEAEWCIQNGVEHHIPGKIRARK